MGQTDLATTLHERIGRRKRRRFRQRLELALGFRHGRRHRLHGGVVLQLVLSRSSPRHTPRARESARQELRSAHQGRERYRAHFDRSRDGPRGRPARARSRRRPAWRACACAKARCAADPSARINSEGKLADCSEDAYQIAAGSSCRAWLHPCRSAGRMVCRAAVTCALAGTPPCERDSDCRVRRGRGSPARTRAFPAGVDTRVESHCAVASDARLRRRAACARRRPASAGSDSRGSTRAPRRVRGRRLRRARTERPRARPRTSRRAAWGGQTARTVTRGVRCAATRSCDDLGRLRGLVKFGSLGSTAGAVWSFTPRPSGADCVRG
jgi:hypothetical protein